MELLRFEAHGLFHRETGIAPAALPALSERLEQIRRELLERREQATANQSEVTPTERCLWLPIDELAEYERSRKTSTVGRVFKTAHRLHELVDAIVILGPPATTLAGQAIMAAGSYPLHNQQTRGERGSKPRIFFDGDAYDNDATSAILQRLNSSRGDDPALHRWAICVLDPGQQTLETSANFGLYLEALKRRLSDEAERFLPDLVVTVNHANSPLATHPTLATSNDRYELPTEYIGPWGALSVAGLLPAALVGVDCMHLLRGAAGVIDHFQNAPVAENTVLQYAAIQYLLGRQHHPSIRSLNIWQQTFSQLGSWYAELAGTNRGSSRSQQGRAVEFITRKWPASYRHYLANPHHLHELPVHLVSRGFREDPLAVELTYAESSTLRSLLQPTLPSLLQAEYQRTKQQLIESGSPSIHLLVPQLHLYAVGQLLQYFLMTTFIEARLHDTEPDLAGT